MAEEIKKPVEIAVVPDVLPMEQELERQERAGLTEVPENAIQPPTTPIS